MLQIWHGAKPMLLHIVAMVLPEILSPEQMLLCLYRACCRKIVIWSCSTVRIGEKIRGSSAVAALNQLNPLPGLAATA